MSVRSFRLPSITNTPPQTAQTTADANSNTPTRRLAGPDSRSLGTVQQTPQHRPATASLPPAWHRTFDSFYFSTRNVIQQQCRWTTAENLTSVSQNQQFLTCGHRTCWSFRESGIGWQPNTESAVSHNHFTYYHYHINISSYTTRVIVQDTGK